MTLVIVEYFALYDIATKWYHKSKKMLENIGVFWEIIKIIYLIIFQLVFIIDFP